MSKDVVLKNIISFKDIRPSKLSIKKHDYKITKYKICSLCEKYFNKTNVKYNIWFFNNIYYDICNLCEKYFFCKKHKTFDICDKIEPCTYKINGYYGLCCSNKSYVDFDKAFSNFILDQSVEYFKVFKYIGNGYFCYCKNHKDICNKYYRKDGILYDCVVRCRINSNKLLNIGNLNFIKVPPELKYLSFQKYITGCGNH